jgi:hypothetical protein
LWQIGPTAKGRILFFVDLLQSEYFVFLSLQFQTKSTMRGMRKLSENGGKFEIFEN